MTKQRNLTTANKVPALNLTHEGNLTAVKQAHKSDSVGLIVCGKLDKERAGPDEEGWVLWIIKSGKPPRQVRIV